MLSTPLFATNPVVLILADVPLGDDKHAGVLAGEGGQLRRFGPLQGDYIDSGLEQNLAE